jgi:hypothetical protein
VVWAAALVLEPRHLGPLLSLDDELEEKSRDSFREYTEAAMRSLRSTMEILSRDVPRVFQVRI